ncbi:MAG: hypothetical protein KGI97_08135 [Alphaproteobacteria bacterium]|nr:hypothetical protein [Alphaproteobacteria bacterium]
MLMNAARIDNLDELDIEFAPSTETSPALDCLNSFMRAAANGQEAAQCIGYAYEFDFREPDYMIFTAPQNGQKHEYLIPVSHQWEWKNGAASYAGSTAAPYKAMKIAARRAERHNRQIAAYAPGIHLGAVAECAICDAIMQALRRYMGTATGYRLKCVIEG